MEMAFSEPVPIYAVVDLGQSVRDLTINENKQVYVLGDDNIVQLNTENFNRNKTMMLEKRANEEENIRGFAPNPRYGDRWARLRLYCSDDGSKFEVAGNLSNLSYYNEYEKLNSSVVVKFVSRRHNQETNGPNAKVVDTKIVSKTSMDPHLRQSLITKLGFNVNNPDPDLYRLAGNIYLASGPNLKNDEETLVAMISEKDNSVTMKLIARICMRSARLRVIGTRVFCYENHLNHLKPNNNIIIFDVWNPMSVEGLAGPVTIRKTNIRRSKTVKPLEFEGGGLAVWPSIWSSLL